MGQKTKAFWATLAHGIGDTTGSFFSPLIPYYMERLGLSLTQTGFLTTVVTLGGGLTQFLFGFLSDRRRPAPYIAFGVLVSAFFMTLSVMAPSYPLLVGILFISGLGRAAYHPAGAALLGTLVPERRGLWLSIFMTGGSLGFVLGPLLLGFLSERLGVRPALLLLLAGIAPLSLLIYAQLRGIGGTAGRKSPVLPSRFTLNPAVLRVFSFVILRSSVYFAFFAFVPVLLKKQGYSLAGTGGMLSLYFLLGTLGSLSGGPLADRLGRRGVLILSALASALLYLTALLSVGAELPPLPFLGTFGVPMVLLALGNGTLHLSNPAATALAQELMPGKEGVASSLTMGVAWGIGGFTTPLVGRLAEALSLESALALWTLGLLLGAWAILPVPEPRDFGSRIILTPKGGKR